MLVDAKDIHVLFIRKMFIENEAPKAKTLRKCYENHEAQIPIFTFSTCKKSILAHYMQAPLQSSKLFFDNLGQ